MNKSAAWIVLLGIIVAAISGFALGRLHGHADVANADTVMPTVDNAGVAYDIHAADVTDMETCQNAEIGFDNRRGVIVASDSNCALDAFSHLGDVTYDDADAAANALVEIQQRYGILLADVAPLVWCDKTMNGDVYSLRVGFYSEEFADNFCTHAVDVDLPCIVLPVTAVDL